MNYYLSPFRRSLGALRGLTGAIAATGRDEIGQTMAEYAILVAVIALVVILAAVFFGTQISSLFNSLGTNL